MNTPTKHISPRQQQRTALSAFSLGELLAKWRKDIKQLKDDADATKGVSEISLRARALERMQCLYELKQAADSKE